MQRPLCLEPARCAAFARATARRLGIRAGSCYATPCRRVVIRNLNKCKRCAQVARTATKVAPGALRFRNARGDARARPHRERCAKHREIRCLHSALRPRTCATRNVPAHPLSPGLRIRAESRYCERSRYTRNSCLSRAATAAPPAPSRAGRRRRSPTAAHATTPARGPVQFRQRGAQRRDRAAAHRPARGTAAHRWPTAGRARGRAPTAGRRVPVRRGGPRAVIAPAPASVRPRPRQPGREQGPGLVRGQPMAAGEGGPAGARTWPGSRAGRGPGGRRSPVTAARAALSRRLPPAAVRRLGVLALTC